MFTVNPFTLVTTYSTRYRFFIIINYNIHKYLSIYSLKKEVAIKNGYDVLYIWDSEYRKVSNERKDKIIQKCVDFLMN